MVPGRSSMPSRLSEESDLDSDLDSFSAFAASAAAALRRSRRPAFRSAVERSKRRGGDEEDEDEGGGGCGGGFRGLESESSRRCRTAEVERHRVVNTGQFA